MNTHLAAALAAPDAPRWLQIAAADDGLAEIPGKDHAPRIVQWLTELGAWWRDDETPWCGTAMAAWMRAAGVPLPRHWYRAKAWAADWGPRLDFPAIGCVVVFDRVGGGHVGLLVGIATDGALLVFGGNQSNAVNVRSFPPSRPATFIWPPGEPLPPRQSPVLRFARAAPESSTEA